MVFGGEVFEKWLGHEVRALINGVDDTIKDTPQSSLIPFAMWKHSKKVATYEPGGEVWPDTESTSALILDFPVLKTANNKLLGS